MHGLVHNFVFSKVLDPEIEQIHLISLCIKNIAVVIDVFNSADIFIRTP
jgi:hypothetical protein